MQPLSHFSALDPKLEPTGLENNQGWPEMMKNMSICPLHMLVDQTHVPDVGLNLRLKALSAAVLHVLENTVINDMGTCVI